MMTNSLLLKNSSLNELFLFVFFMYKIDFEGNQNGPFFYKSLMFIENECNKN